MSAHSEVVREFTLEVPQAALDDLDRRLAATRWPDGPVDADWTYGAPASYLKDLTDYWRHQYDWRAAEAELTRHPQFTTAIDGHDIHFLHVRSPEPQATPLIITHGWPSSPVEYLDVIDLLTNPRAHGGDPADAFHLVIPSLPGYGLSGPTRDNGWGSRRIAGAWVKLMHRLGYRRYGAHGSDWGTWISRELGTMAPAEVIGVHGCGFITWPSGDPEEMAGLDGTDHAKLAFGEHYMSQLYGYKLIQSSRPQALAYGLSDSPTGLAGWIASVYKEWSDCRQTPDEAVGRDRLLTTIMLYWLTNTAGSAARSFVETPDTPDDADLDADVAATDTPTGVACFAKGVLRPVRRFAERDNNIVAWNEYDFGGTFAAAEHPVTVADDITAFFRNLR